MLSKSVKSQLAHFDRFLIEQKATSLKQYEHKRALEIPKIRNPGYFLSIAASLSPI